MRALVSVSAFALLLAIHSAAAGEWNYYDAYTGDMVSEDVYLEHVAANTTYWCLNYLESCNASEHRRIDGSCINVNYPQRGAAHTPNYRMLPAQYSSGHEPRFAASGEDLPLARKVRTTLLSEGRVSDQHFTNLVNYIGLLVTNDVASVHDTINYLYWRNCCDEDESDDPEGQCIPIVIPEDDPVHRFSGHRCLNLTKPLSYQSQGCADPDTPYDRMVSEQPLLDLSQIYGENLDSHLTGRVFERGLMNYEILEDGSVWPPTGSPPDWACDANRLDLNETRCHSVPTGFNALIGSNIASIWIWRNHYRIANAIADLNPCWDDDYIFYISRDINTAMVMQMLYYEYFPALNGYDNMLNAGIITEDPSFRDLYDEESVPDTGFEFIFALRWLHVITESNLQLTQADGVVIGEIPFVNLTFRTGYLGVDNNLELLTHAAYRQAAAAHDNVVDPDMAERGMANHQAITDLPAADLTKNRYFGLPPYIDYLSLCVNKNITTWEDLVDYMSPENIENLQKIYDDITDVDLLAGMWIENSVEGGYAPTTFACITNDRLYRNMVLDRHWYERADRPYAFTEAQLLEIRKTNMADLLCKLGDNVSQVQPNPFVRIMEGNLLQSCDTYESIDFYAWADDSCWA